MSETHVPQSRPIRLLVTGFGPFPGVAVNASEKFVADLAPRLKPISGLSLATRVLPTLWGESISALGQALAEARPDIALHFGVSQRARGLEIESRARNVCTLEPDAAGRAPTDCRLVAGGPAWLSSDLDLARVCRAVRACGAPARVSGDAGSYLCNAVYYASLRAARQLTPRRSALFVHLPFVLAPGGEMTQGHSLPAALALRAGVLLVRELCRSVPAFGPGT